MTSKQKWSIMVVVSVISFTMMVVTPMYFDIRYGIPTFMLSFFIAFATACYILAGMVEHKMFEKFFEWLNRNDV